MESGLLAAYVGLGAMAVFPIVIGSFVSLAEDKKSSTGASSAERMGSKDAYMFPLIGSVTLFGFYLLFKYFNPQYINILLTAYFSFFGVYAVSSVMEELSGMVFSEKITKLGQFWMNIGGTTKKPKWQLEVTAIKILAVLLTLYYVMTKNWIASNILGMSFATSAISLIHLDSFATGGILLAGLFVYDIFWVFGTNVMVKVAKSFDVPVKLLFPKNLNFINPAPKDFCLLGLGDIVIPGIFVALCYRFDDFVKTKYSFYAFSLAFYILGLATTMAVMHIFKAAQPALLYLCPACILSVILCGALNRNLRTVLQYKSEQTPKGQADKLPRSPAKSLPRSPAKTHSPAKKDSNIEEVVTPSRPRRHSKSE